MGGRGLKGGGVKRRGRGGDMGRGRAWKGVERRERGREWVRMNNMREKREGRKEERKREGERE